MRKYGALNDNDYSVRKRLLSGFFALFLGTHVLQSTHIVQTVRQLDQDDPDILCHGEEHLAEVLGLFGL